MSKLSIIKSKSFVLRENIIVPSCTIVPLFDYFAVLRFIVWIAQFASIDKSYNRPTATILRVTWISTAVPVSVASQLRRSSSSTRLFTERRETDSCFAESQEFAASEWRGGEQAARWAKKYFYFFKIQTVFKSFESLLFVLKTKSDNVRFSCRSLHPGRDSTRRKPSQKEEDFYETQDVESNLQSSHQLCDSARCSASDWDSTIHRPRFRVCISSRGPKNALIGHFALNITWLYITQQPSDRLEQLINASRLIRGGRAAAVERKLWGRLYIIKLTCDGRHAL